MIRKSIQPGARMFQIINPIVVGGAVALAIFVGVVLCLMLGRRIGLRAIARDGIAGTPNIGSLEAAVFALLGLLIAFTFSGALSRFDVRRVQAVDEANAIGTAYLRIDLLPGVRAAGAARELPQLRRCAHRHLPQAARRQGGRARARALAGTAERDLGAGGRRRALAGKPPGEPNCW